MGWLSYGDSKGFAIGFASGGLDDDTLVLRGLWGRERLSRLYEFELILERQGAAELTAGELKAVLAKPCTVAMGPTEDDLVFGILESTVVKKIWPIDDTPSDKPGLMARLMARAEAAQKAANASSASKGKGGKKK